MLVTLDNHAAHNVIDAGLIQDGAGKAAIRQLQRKTVAGVDMVLLQFSIECHSSSDTKLKLCEWFRIADCQPQSQVIIRGLFDNDRIQSSDNCLSSTSAFSQPSDQSVSAKHRKQLAASDTANAEERALKEKEVEFERRTKRHRPDSRFVSLHPVSHRPIRRDVEHPPRQEDPEARRFVFHLL